jgi:hypothetical protein
MSGLIVRVASRNDAMHVPPDSWLGGLLSCPCGHGIGRHRGGTCAGDYRGKCRCRLDATAVLDNSVRDACD